MNRLVLGFCRRVMPPLQRVPVGGPGRPNSVVAERRPPTPASDRRGHGTGDGTPARSARRPDRPPDGADPGKHREGAVVQLSGGKPVSADPPAGRSVSGNRCPPRWSPSEGHGWSRTRTWRYARHTVTWGASGPTGQTWSEPDPFRLGSRGKRLRMATGVGASSTIWPHRSHSQRRAGGYASAHQSCVVKSQATRFKTSST